MANAFRVVVPSPGRRTIGILRPAAGAHGGVLILEDPGTHSSLPHAICAEVGLYLHAAGFNTLSLSIPEDADLGTRVSRIVGGVTMLRSLNRDKIVLITLAPPHAVSRAAATAASLAALLDQASHEARSLPDVVRVVQDLSVTIRDVAESVVGVAALVEQSQAPGAGGDAAHTHPHPHTLHTTALKLPASTRPDNSGNAAGIVSGSAGPASLILSLPATDDAAFTARVVAQTVSRLYNWTLSLTRAGNTQAASARPAQSSSALLPVWMAEGQTQPAALRADWHARLRWADTQWAALLTVVTGRDPVRGALARKASISTGMDTGYSVRGARLAWRHLTGEERQAWLGICSTVFQLRSLSSGVLR